MVVMAAHPRFSRHKTQCALHADWQTALPRAATAASLAAACCCTTAATAGTNIGATCRTSSPHSGAYLQATAASLMAGQASHPAQQEAAATALADQTVGGCETDACCLKFTDKRDICITFCGRQYTAGWCCRLEDSVGATPAVSSHHQLRLRGGRYMASGFRSICNSSAAAP
jgi:hypothetical protein